jgi:DNA-binding IclR family transcriptional regulator
MQAEFYCMKVTSEDDRYVVRSVVRALDVLMALSTQNGSVSLADLAKETGLNPSTAFRLLESMRVRGFVRQADGGSGYQLDSRVVAIQDIACAVHVLRAAQEQDVGTIVDLGVKDVLAT